MRKEFSAKVKVEAVMRCAGHCEGCGRKLLHTGDFNFDFDHTIPDQLGGEPTLDNCAVLCKSCHKTKTTTEDVPRIAKAKRNYRTAHGIKKQRTIKAWRRFDGSIVYAGDKR